MAMIINAYKLTGYVITNEIFTKIEFDKIKKNNPQITFDNAILLFENAPKDISLEQFAITKMRTADSYRNVYRDYFYTK